MTRMSGWWSYDGTDRPTLINRQSGERLRESGDVQVAGKRFGQRWIRLNYLHDDLAFPLLVCWMPDEGQIVVDYLESATLWRKEANSDLPFPPYGAWVRVDDCVIDALWCWPGVIEQLKWKGHDAEAGGGWIGRTGGWCNGNWRPELARVDIFLLEGSRDRYESAEASPLGDLTPLNEAAGSPWFYCDPICCEDYERLGYAEWEGEPLHAEESAEVQEWYYGGTKGIYQQGGRRTVEIRGGVPQMRSQDGKRILYPFEAGIVYPEFVHERDPGPPADSIELRCGTKDAGHFNVRYCRPGPWERGGQGAMKRKIWPRFHVTGGGRDLSLCARRRHIRDVADAFLFWEGTSEAPELWGPRAGDVLSYEKPEFIAAEDVAIGGRMAPVKSFASLAQPRRWKAFGFDLPRFLGRTR